MVFWRNANTESTNSEGTSNQQLLQLLCAPHYHLQHICLPQISFPAS
uniref:Uncharacterized protein n=1 Tax=Arundo donax TaxID=35708 RepID=A0A0A9HHA8_ARUDO